MLLAIFSASNTLETSEMSAIFQVYNQSNSSSSPGLAYRSIWRISSLNTKFFQIWSSVTAYGELNVCF